jgi:hypothetical protein
MVDAELRARLMALDSDEAMEAAAILESKLDYEQMPADHAAIVAPLIQQARDHYRKHPEDVVTREQMKAIMDAQIKGFSTQQMAV